MEESLSGFSQESNSPEMLALLEQVEKELESDKHPYLTEVSRFPYGFPGFFGRPRRFASEKFLFKRRRTRPFKGCALFFPLTIPTKIDTTY